MPWRNISHHLLLPELVLDGFYAPNRHRIEQQCHKTSSIEVCPKCATPSQSVYDRRTVRVKDAPIRGQRVTLKIRKRRFWCRPCMKPFTEPVAGVLKGSRCTQRFKRDVLWAAEHFVDLKSVQRTYGVSPGFLFKAIYGQLELKRRMNQYPWPRTIGIDEHSFRRTRGRTEFASMIVDFNHRRVFELVDGKSGPTLEMALAHIPGRENVANVVLDLCDPFKNFARSFFPNAKIVADKFHVLRLIMPAIIRRRNDITGTRSDWQVRRLLTMSSRRFDHWQRRAIWQYLERYPELHELYFYKEALHGFYRTKGYNKAAAALTRLTDRMASSQIPEVQTLRKTLMKWREEILNYFINQLTNGMTEGFNNIAKLVQRRAFGYRNFNNYRLRLLSACA